MPIGMPGWPDFAVSTASIAKARSAPAIFQRSGCASRASICVSPMLKPFPLFVSPLIVWNPDSRVGHVARVGAPAASPPVALGAAEVKAQPPKSA